MATYLPGFGIVGGVLYSVVLTCYPAGQMLGAYSINVGLILTWGFFYYVNTLADETLLCLASGAIGFFMFPILQVSFELAVE